ncbi:hypothetical protein Tco_0936735 [Tanacetum coccineum]|uniref:Uncharacterized protein n=1 Tax=Tanacetum coccineum TaxID=301880 RepID=A0ABQ5DC77_9ASTR
MHVASALRFEGLPPLEFLLTLPPSLFGASSNSTTLSLYLQTLRDTVRRTGVVSLTRGFEDFIVTLNESRADHRIRIGQGGCAIGEWHVFRRCEGATNGATSYANMDTIKLRWGSKSLGLNAGLPSLE